MAFQSQINIEQGYGVPGDKYSDSPVRAAAYSLNSASDDLNIVGQTMYTIPSGLQGVAAAGNDTGVPGTNTFAGLLVNPKVYASLGTQADGPLAPTMTIKNNSVGELATMGQFFVSLPALANIGDLVIYDNLSGAIETIPPGTPLPAGYSFGFAEVKVFIADSVGDDGRFLAVIELTPTLVIPV